MAEKFNISLPFCAAINSYNSPCMKREAVISVLSLTENTLKLSLPLRASEVILDSEVHFVSEVSPDGEVMGKLNFTASEAWKLHCA